MKIPRSTLYLLAANSTPETLREEFARRVEAGEPPLTHAELKAEIESHRPSPAQIAEKSVPRRPARRLRDEILAHLDEATSLLNGKSAAAREALESAKKLVETLDS